jgi:hypothetical protein
VTAWMVAGARLRDRLRASEVIGWLSRVIRRLAVRHGRLALMGLVGFLLGLLVRGGPRTDASPGTPPARVAAATVRVAAGSTAPLVLHAAPLEIGPSPPATPSARRRGPRRHPGRLEVRRQAGWAGKPARSQ